MITRDEEFTSLIEEIAESLTTARDLVSENNILDFQKNARTLKESLQVIKEENRAIRIGIVGEVKAGKSSFLNALIFNGDSILPKAPTPMTAALTKITYGKEFEGCIVFYTQKDWQLIERNMQDADQFMKNLYEEHIKKCGTLRIPMSRDQFYKRNENKIPQELKSCKELVEMAERNKINIYEYLGETIKIRGKDQDDFIRELNEYVGSGGHYTPIVKHTEIQLNNELLKNAEIIDTPGLNDPIISRGRTTMDFLVKCDIVFFLSYTGQFLTKEDLDFLSNILPGESVNRAVLIGSKFDSGILDYKEQSVPLKKALKASQYNFNKQADNIFGEALKDPNCAQIIHNIGENLPPKYVSAIMYTIATKIEKQQMLSEEEEHLVKTFERRFQGFSRNPELLKDLSNIEGIQKEELERILAQKDEIIVEKVKNTIRDKQIYFLKELETINIQARTNRQDLQTYDLGELQNKIDSISKTLNKIRYNIQEIFTSGSVRAQKTLETIKVEVEREIDNFVGVSVTPNSESHNGTHRTGFLGLFKEHYTQTVVTNTASVQEAISGIRQYVIRSKELINTEFDKLFDLKSMKKQITNEVTRAFDVVDEEYNEQEILLPLNSALCQITIPKIKLEATKYDQKLTDEFTSSIVKNEDISRLMLTQDRIMAEINKDIVTILDLKAKEIDGLLMKQANTFVDNIEYQLRDNVQKVQALLKDKENSLQKYNDFIEQIVQYKNQIVQYS
ncbi:dynamin family protein [Ectobacillus sp. sgz5001026]|uniref:dynamin family protein n=1 Tax=Ectobacillus sp. sgz5001026 TaxID=3242473 RepID=UPI0036D3565E